MRCAWTLAGIAAVAIAAAGAIGCEVIVGIRDRQPLSNGSGSCGGGPPQKPAIEDGTGSATIQLAVRTIDLGLHAPADAGVAGYNLDGDCTCPPQGTCQPRVPGPKECDPGGIDNAATATFQLISHQTNGLLDQDAYNAQIGAGTWSTLLRIRQYNGGANDAQVEVSVFVSDGISNPQVPAWDGNDTWTLATESVLAGSGPDAYPAYLQVDAFVTNHVLVANLRSPLRINGGPRLGTLTFTEDTATLTGTLTPERGSYRIDDGMIAGRWPTSNLAAAMSTAADPAVDGGFLCPGTPSFEILSRLVCQQADIMADPANTSPNATCDALSFGIRFTAYPAVMGPTTDGGPPTTCPDAGAFQCP